MQGLVESPSGCRGKLCFVLNPLALIVDWACDTANVSADTSFQDVVECQTDFMVIFTDDGFAKTDWHPDNLNLCHRAEWNNRMMVETVLWILTLVCHFRKVMHRTCAYFESL